MFVSVCVFVSGCVCKCMNVGVNECVRKYLFQICFTLFILSLKCCRGHFPENAGVGMNAKTHQRILSVASSQCYETIMGLYLQVCKYRDIFQLSSSKKYCRIHDAYAQKLKCFVSKN